MTGDQPAKPQDDPFTVDPTVAHPARIYNYLLGGKDNFEVDRKAADYIYAALPGGVETARGLWRPAEVDASEPRPQTIPAYGGLGRKG